MEDIEQLKEEAKWEFDWKKSISSSWGWIIKMTFILLFLSKLINQVDKITDPYIQILFIFGCLGSTLYLMGRSGRPNTYMKER